MIFEQTKEALTALFPVKKAPEEKEQCPGEETEEGAKDVAEEAVRENGILETDYAVHGYHLDVQVAPEQLVEAVSIIDSLGYFIESITGVDWIDDNQLEAVYDFSRYDFDLCRVVVRVRVDRENPLLPTITGVYAGANWHERETHELLGIIFEGHPHLIPLLLPEDADFHPLRKDFKA